MSNTKVEVLVDEKCLSIWFGGRQIFRLWVSDDGQGHGHAPNPEALDWSQTTPPMSGLKKLEVHAILKEKEKTLMALPRLRSQRLEESHIFRPASKAAAQRSSGSTGSLIDTRVRDLIYNAVLDSILAHPEASKSETAKESLRIAKELNVRVGSVAAVRANYTRGRYGDPDTELAVRKSWLQRNKPEKFHRLMTQGQA